MVDSDLLLEGIVIPAHPLALTAERKLDELRQVALTRYYCDAGAGGFAVGVHTTQFAIRDPHFGLFEPILRLAAATLDEFERAGGLRLLRVAGVCGKTPQAVSEACLARNIGYRSGLVEPGRTARRVRCQIDRALPSGRGSDPRDGLLPSALRGWPALVVRIL